MRLVPSATPARHPSGPAPNLSPAQPLLHELLVTAIVPAEDWERLNPAVKSGVTASRDDEDLLRKLVDCNLLTA